MYVCEKCGCQFEYPHEILRGGGYPEENDYVCPQCGESWDAEEAVMCEVCGMWKHPNDMASKYCCDGCANLYNDVEYGLKYLAEENNEAEFFVGWLFQSNPENASQALISLCRGAWEAMGEYGVSELRDYITECKEDFAAWLECQFSS